AVAFLAVSTLIIVAHILDVREDNDVGVTTAFAMMLTFALAAWSMYGYELPALGVTIIVMALLGYKPVLHSWLRKMKTEELYGTIKLLIISVVLLPLLPDQGYGPWQALNPYWVWLMVVLITALSFLGYFAIRIAGNKVGTLVTAITGGLASSTAVTVSFAQFAREYEIKKLFMGGVMIASSIMFIRVLIEVSVVNPELLAGLWIPISAMFVAMIAGGWWLWNSTSRKSGSDKRIELQNPFQLGTALKFGLLLALILLLSEGMQEWFGDQGVYVLSVASGLMDVDAITLSLSKMATDSLEPNVAIVGIVLATATNTLVKGAIFAFYVGIRESLNLLILILLVAFIGVGLTFLT
ncbi:MAG: MgtC/SapB family protein, partial [Balneolaceae bacterium]|nr:MgtC/SapB family protein [Balneolaceae bacterium]